MIDLLAELSAHPAGTALVSPAGRRVSRGALAQAALRMADSLHGQGIAHHSRVAVCVPPGYAAVALVLALRALGAVVVIADPRVGPDVLASHLRHARVDALVHSDLVAAAAGWARPFARRAGVRIPPLASLAPQCHSVRGLLATPPGTVPLSLPPLPGSCSDAVVIFTSGTTSAPRAVVHSDATLSAALGYVASLVDPVPGAPVLAGTFFATLPALAAGAVVHMPSRVPLRLARQLSARRWHATYLTPPQWRSALRWKPRLSGMTYAGSAPVSGPLLSAMLAAGARRAYGVYALTEALPVAVVDAREKADYDGLGDLVGAPVPQVSAWVDEQGTLRLEGPNVSPGYLGYPRTGALDTGDRALIDSDGRIVLTGRAKDMILRRAENIYPGLYEPLLHVPGVSLAVLVPVASADGDEKVVALVQLEPAARPATVRRALRTATARMGRARPDAVVFADVPLAGRSRKPDRPTASVVAGRALSHRVRFGGSQ